VTILLAQTTIPRLLATGAASLAALICTVLLLMAMRQLRGTTLVAPAAWSLGAVGILAVVELSAATAGWPATSPWLVNVRFAASMLTFCPLVSLLGARRPQHGPWQLVVLSLLVVLCLPAAEAHWVRGGAAVSLGLWRAWFLLLLILMAAVLWLPTRNWPSGLCYSGGLGCLVSRQLDWFALPAHFPAAAIALAAFCAGLAIAAVRRTVGANSHLPPETILWRRFRDAYGALWALQVQQRIVDQAARRKWPVEVDWSGFEFPSQVETDALPQERREIRLLLVSTLKRFLAPQWLVSLRPTGRQSTVGDPEATTAGEAERE